MTTTREEVTSSGREEVQAETEGRQAPPVDGGRARPPARPALHALPAGRDALARAADAEYRRRRARDRKAAELRTRERDDLRARMVVADAKALLLEMPVEPFHVVLRRRMILCGWDPSVEGELSVREVAEHLLDEMGPDPLWREHRRVLLAGVVEPVGKPWKTPPVAH